MDLDLIKEASIALLLERKLSDPHNLLGLHSIEKNGEKYFIIRVYDPHCVSIKIIVGRKKYTMTELKEGFFIVEIKDRKKSFKYKIEHTYGNTTSYTIEDQYSFLPTISEFELHLFGEGNLEEAYKMMGSHITTIDGIEGVKFAIWAPDVRNVSVVGDFNAWDGRRNQMRVLGDSGVWEIFIPGIKKGTIYKYDIIDEFGGQHLKTDPYGFKSQMRPETASIVWDLDNFEWNDQQWVGYRIASDWLKKPISTYEVHLGSWMKTGPGENDFLNYKDLAHKLAAYVLEMGYTFIEIMPIMEHPLDMSWGYQVIGYYSVTARFGTPEEFKYFVDFMHQHGIGVIMDWVPGHFPKDAHGLANFTGKALYEYADPRKGEHMEWGTKVFDYGKNGVRNFLISNAVFWAEEYHIDGFRVDAVASILHLNYARKEGEWVPNEFGGCENLEAVYFIRRLNEIMHGRYPGIQMIAEESTSWSGVSSPTYAGGLGFTFKWNMGWMNDFIKYMNLDPIFRKYYHNQLTFSMMYAHTEKFVLVLSHDEVVHGKGSWINKMPGWEWDKFANARASLGFMFGHPGKKLMFQGIDFAQFSEWNEAVSIDWHLLNNEPNRKLNQFVKDINHLYKNEPALYEGDHTENGFEWIDCNDWESSIVSFIRRADDGSFLIFILNFTPVSRVGYRLGVPYQGFYNEIINSDSENYWGSNLGNNGGVWSEEIPWQNQPHSIDLVVPPLSCLVFKM